MNSLSRVTVLNRWFVAMGLLCLLGLSSCVTPVAKKAAVVDAAHGLVTINIWRQYTLIEDDGKNASEKTGPGNYGIEMIRVFKKGASWMAEPAALVWRLYENQWPQQVELVLPEGDYVFDIVVLSINGFPLKAQAVGDGLASFHVTAGRKVEAGDIIFEFIKRYRIYPNQRVATRFMRFKSTPKDAEANLNSDPEKKLELSDS